MEKLTFSPTIKNAEFLLKYLESIHDKSGKPSMMTHRRLLKGKNEEALFCDNFLKMYEISADTLEKIIKDNFEGYSLYCVICGKKLKERNIRSKYQTCSHKCGSLNVLTKQILSKSKSQLGLGQA